MTHDSKELLALADELKQELSFMIGSPERMAMFEHAERVIRDLSTAPQPGMRAEGEAGAAANLLRSWAKAYRDTPEHRFPSDPNAEFFPVDLERAADLLTAPPKPAPDAMREALQAEVQIIEERYGRRLKFLENSLHGDALQWRRLTNALALSAPVPPPHGAAKRTAPERCPHCFDETDCSNIDVCNAAADQSPAPPSDDVRSALQEWIDQGYIDAEGEHCGSAAYAPKLYAKSVAALRSAPVSAAATEFDPANFAERIEQTSRLFTVREADSYGSAVHGVRIDCFYDFEVNRLIRFLRNVSAPAVGVTREAIARTIAPESFAADYQHYYPDRSMLEQFEAFKKADAILARSPVPDATVSEPVAWRWQHVNDRREPRPWHYEDAPFRGNEYMQSEPLYTSPQHVGREAAVSNEDHRKAVAHFLCRLNQQWLSTDPCWHSCKMCLEPNSRWFEWADKLIALAPVSARDAVIAEARHEVALAIAFLNRDVNTDRITETVRQLIPKLANADEKLRSLTGAKP